MVKINETTVATAIAGDAIDRCLERGKLIFKDACYALQKSNGSDIWLEMDRIPMNLFEQQVLVEGQRFGPNLIWVSAIGPD